MTKKVKNDGLKNLGPLSKTMGELPNFTITKNGVIRCVNIYKKVKGKFVP